MVNYFRSGLLACTGIALVAGAGAAHAQDSADENDAATPANNVIIVTAQKREERLQDVPLTVSVVTSEQLNARSITNLNDLQNTSVELGFQAQPSSGYSIRGSGTQTFTRSAENNVLVVLDGVVQGQLTPPSNSLFDIERVEVLSGPQGLLFGKNASAGVVNIVSRRPELGELSARVRGSYGEDDFLVVDGTINAPMGDRAALRITGFLDEIGDRFFNRFNNEGVGARSSYGGRARLLWEPTDSLELIFNADYEKADGGNSAWQARQLNPGGVVANALAACGVVPSVSNTDVCLDGNLTFETQSYGASLEANYDLGGPTLTGIFAYRYFERNSDTDSDARPTNILNVNSVDEDVKQWSAEVRLTSPSGGLVDYVAGLFFYDYTYNPIIEQAGRLGALPASLPPAAASFDSVVNQRSYAAFGQATVNVSDQFKLIAGGRYTYEELDFFRLAYTNPNLGARYPFFGGQEGTFTRAIDTNNFSWRLGAQYLPSTNVTFFAAVSRGFKGPAINPIAQGSLAPDVVRAEIPTNYEIGIKGGTSDGTLRAELTLFRTEVKDFQTQTVAEVNGLTQFVFANADSLTFEGAQLNVGLRPTRGLSFDIGLLYNNATYGDLFVECNQPFTTGCQTIAGRLVTNVNGNQLAFAPELKLTFGGDYETSLTQSIDGFVQGAATLIGDRFASATPDPNLVIDGNVLVDARIGIRAADRKWSASIFARNLFDDRTPSLIFRDPVSPNLNYMQAFGNTAFRTIGATVEFNF